MYGDLKKCTNKGQNNNQQVIFEHHEGLAAERPFKCYERWGWGVSDFLEKSVTKV